MTERRKQLRTKIRDLRGKYGQLQHEDMLEGELEQTKLKYVLKVCNRIIKKLQQMEGFEKSPPEEIIVDVLLRKYDVACEMHGTAKRAILMWWQADWEGKHGQAH